MNGWMDIVEWTDGCVHREKNRWTGDDRGIDV